MRPLRVDLDTHKKVANLATEIAQEYGDEGNARYYAALAFDIEDHLMEALSQVEIEDYGTWSEEITKAERLHRIGA